MPDSPRSPAISGVVAGLRPRLEAAEHPWWGQDLLRDLNAATTSPGAGAQLRECVLRRSRLYARNARRAEFDGPEWSHERYSRLLAMILANLADLRLPRLSILEAGGLE
jgi:hypothetical protein